MRAVLVAHRALQQMMGLTSAAIACQPEMAPMDCSWLPVPLLPVPRSEAERSWLPRLPSLPADLPVASMAAQPDMFSDKGAVACGFAWAERWVRT